MMFVASQFVAGSVRLTRFWNPGMTSVTIRVLQGMGQGRVFSHLPLPVSVGREEGNSIQLNDDQISRFHARIQEHEGRVIITDLESTNGTSVNGHPIQVRIIQKGDVIKIGRCVLLFAERPVSCLSTSSHEPDPFRTAYVRGGAMVDDESKHLEFQHPLPGSLEEPEALFPGGRPELPSEMSTLQRIQLSDLLSHLHERLGVVIKAASEELGESNSRFMEIDWDAWNKLISVQVDLCVYIDGVLPRQPSS